MIINQTHVVNVAVIKPEDDPPVTRYSYRLETGQVAAEPV